MEKKSVLYALQIYKRSEKKNGDENGKNGHYYLVRIYLLLFDKLHQINPTMKLESTTSQSTENTVTRKAR